MSGILRNENETTGHLVNTKRLNIILFLVKVTSRVYTITLIIAVLFTRVMTLTNILILKNNIDVMLELFGVLRGRAKKRLLHRDLKKQEAARLS